VFLKIKKRRGEGKSNIREKIERRFIRLHIYSAYPETIGEM
jgi:hypothetical protein